MFTGREQRQDPYPEESGAFRFWHLTVAFVGGAIAGAAAALLTTPVTGRESREHLKRFAARSRDALARTPGYVRQGLLRGKHRAQELVDERLGR